MKTGVSIRITLLILIFTAYAINSFADATVCQKACADAGSAAYACENPCSSGFEHTTKDQKNADDDCKKNVVTNPTSMCCCKWTVDCSKLDQASCDTGANAGKCYYVSANCVSCAGLTCSNYNLAECATDPCKIGCEAKQLMPDDATETCVSKGPQPTVSGGFVKEECKCFCGKDKDGNSKEIDATGLYKPGFMDFSGTSSAAAKCQAQCARTCGGMTDCPKDGKTCSDCCDDYCTNDFKAGDGAGTGADDPVPLCKAACNSTCDFRGTINGITDIIYTVAAIIGAIMLAIHGIRLVTSSDAGARDAAKASMAYVILALIIIALAGAAVRMLTNMGT